MKPEIAILINSRGNPETLIATCLSMIALSARADWLHFCIRADIDDFATIDSVGRIAKHTKVSYIIRPQPKSLDACINDLAALAPEAGFFTVLNDDVFPTTPNWDVAIRCGLQDGDVSVWLPAIGEESSDYPIWTRAWYDAIGGKLFPSCFAYWFGDRWNMDVVAIGAPERLKRLHIRLLAKKIRSQRMRDLAFWFEYYLFLEPERIELAQMVCDRIGTGVNVRTDPARVRNAQLLLEDHRRCGEVLPLEYAALHDERPPSQAYLAAKGAADAHMASMRRAAE